MFWEIFYNLCLSIQKKPLQVVKELGIANGSITKWKNGSIPNGTTLKKLSDYFGVSVDFLLGEEKTPAAVSDEDIKVALFGGDTEVSDEMWNEVMNYAEYIKQKYGKT